MDFVDYLIIVKNFVAWVNLNDSNHYCFGLQDPRTESRVYGVAHSGHYAPKPAGNYGEVETHIRARPLNVRSFTS